MVLFRFCISLISLLISHPVYTSFQITFALLKLVYDFYVIYFFHHVHAFPCIHMNMPRVPQTPESRIKPTPWRLRFPCPRLHPNPGFWDLSLVLTKDPGVWVQPPFLAGHVILGTQPLPLSDQRAQGSSLRPANSRSPALSLSQPSLIFTQEPGNWVSSPSFSR